MAGAKEIRGKIRSIQNTQKITHAMEMVAGSKMRKAQDRMRTARPYAEKMRNVIAHCSAAHHEYTHPYLVQRDEVRRVGYVVVSSDRGLCGGLNNNLFRSLVRDFDAYRDKNIEKEIHRIHQQRLVVRHSFNRFDNVAEPYVLADKHTKRCSCHAQRNARQDYSKLVMPYAKYDSLDMQESRCHAPWNVRKVKRFNLNPPVR